MAKSVADKLLIKPAAAVWSSDPSRLKLVGPMLGGVRSADALGDADAALVFALRFRALEEGEPAFTGA
jgi:hypothetical protein